jgi:hypothetical protein
VSTIGTPAMLDSLPVGAVVLDAKDWSWTKVDDTEREHDDGTPMRTAWACVAWKRDRTSWEMFGGGEFVGQSVGPFTVLWTPAAGTSPR